jgi:trehalose-6-phosphate synthase
MASLATPAPAAASAKQEQAPVFDENSQCIIVANASWVKVKRNTFELELGAGGLGSAIKSAIENNVFTIKPVYVCTQRSDEKDKYLTGDEIRRYVESADFQTRRKAAETAVAELSVSSPDSKELLDAEHALSDLNILAACTIHTVEIDKNDYDAFYEGTSNSVLWPLSHDLPREIAAPRDDRDRNAYERVNGKVAERVAAIAAALHAKSPKKCVFHIEDYQFSEVPARLRAELTKHSEPLARDSQTHFFYHIPVPSASALKAADFPLPVHTLNRLLLPQIAGMGGADVIGLQTSGDVAKFVELAKIFANLDCKTIETGRAVLQTPDGRQVLVSANGIGLDYAARAQNALHGGRTVSALRKKWNDIFTQAFGPNRVRLGACEREDYTKGIPERLEQIYALLIKHPELMLKFGFVQVGAPSRQGIPAYQHLHLMVSGLVQRINSYAREFARDNLFAIAERLNIFQEGKTHRSLIDSARQQIEEINELSTALDTLRQDSASEDNTRIAREREIQEGSLRLEQAQENAQRTFNRIKVLILKEMNERTLFPPESLDLKNVVGLQPPLNSEEVSGNPTKRRQLAYEALKKHCATPANPHPLPEQSTFDEWIHFAEAASLPIVTAETIEELTRIASPTNDSPVVLYKPEKLDPFTDMPAFQLSLDGPTITPINDGFNLTIGEAVALAAQFANENEIDATEHFPRAFLLGQGAGAGANMHTYLREHFDGGLPSEQRTELERLHKQGHRDGNNKAVSQAFMNRSALIATLPPGLPQRNLSNGSNVFIVPVTPLSEKTIQAIENGSPLEDPGINQLGHGILQLIHYASARKSANGNEKHGARSQNGLPLANQFFERMNARRHFAQRSTDLDVAGLSAPRKPLKSIEDLKHPQSLAVQFTNSVSSPSQHNVLLLGFDGILAVYDRNYDHFPDRAAREQVLQLAAVLPTPLVINTGRSANSIVQWLDTPPNEPVTLTRPIYIIGQGGFEIVKWSGINQGAFVLAPDPTHIADTGRLAKRLEQNLAEAHVGYTVVNKGASISVHFPRDLQERDIRRNLERVLDGLVNSLREDFPTLVKRVAHNGFELVLGDPGLGSAIRMIEGEVKAAQGDKPLFFSVIDGLNAHANFPNNLPWSDFRVVVANEANSRISLPTNPSARLLNSGQVLMFCNGAVAQLAI